MGEGEQPCRTSVCGDGRSGREGETGRQTDRQRQRDNRVFVCKNVCVRVRV